MHYNLYSCSTREAIDTVEMHVLAKAYRAAWRSMWASDPAGPHPMNALDLMIDFGPSRELAVLPAPEISARSAEVGTAHAAVAFASRLPPADWALTAGAVAAAEFARWAHRDQRIENGVTPYFDGHVLAVAEILREIGASEPVLAAGYLREVIGRTTVTLDQIEERFGAYVASLVAGASDAWRYAANGSRTRHEVLELDRLALESAEVQTLRLAQDLANLRDPRWLRQAVRNGWLAEVAARTDRLVLANAQLLRRVQEALALWQAIPNALAPEPDAQ